MDQSTPPASTSRRKPATTPRLAAASTISSANPALVDPLQWVEAIPEIAGDYAYIQVDFSNFEAQAAPDHELLMHVVGKMEQYFDIGIVDTIHVTIIPTVNGQFKKFIVISLNMKLSHKNVPPEDERTIELDESRPDLTALLKFYRNPWGNKPPIKEMLNYFHEVDGYRFDNLTAELYLFCSKAQQRANDLKMFTDMERIGAMEVELCEEAVAISAQIENRKKKVVGTRKQACDQEYSWLRFEALMWKKIFNSKVAQLKNHLTACQRENNMLKQENSLLKEENTKFLNYMEDDKKTIRNLNACIETLKKDT